MSLLSLLIINGSDLVNQPWNTTFSPYINLLGQGWLLIPISFLAAAIFVKTHDPALLSGFMIITGAMLTAGSLVGGIFAGFAPATFIYLLFTVIGIAVLFYNVFYGGR
jgi:hypothetical protein